MIDRLEFMIVLDRERHFGRAAAGCGVAQPTFSLGIQKLEEALNVQLVKRSSRFIGFTPEGERMLTWARRIVGDARAMRQDILGLSSESEGQVRLAAIPSVMSLVARLTVPFQTKHPKLKLTLLSRSSNAILSMLNQREIDAGITYLSNEPIGEVVATPIYREEYRLLVTNTGLFADREVVTWAEAATIPLCLLERDMQNRRIVDGVLRRLDVEPTPMMETDSMPALFSYVRLGHCGSIVPSSAAEPAQLGDDLRAIPLVEPELHHIVGLVVSKRFPAQPAVTALVHAASMLAPQLRGARFSGD